MAKVTLSSLEQAEQLNISPDYVRLSMAAAIELGLKKGRLFRDAGRLVMERIAHRGA